MRATNTNTPTGKTGALSLAPVGVVFRYMETNGKDYGQNIFIGVERVNIFQESSFTRINGYQFQIDQFQIQFRLQIQMLLSNRKWYSK